MTLASDLSEVWKDMSSTEVYTPPSAPPPASDSATTDVWKPVTYLGLTMPPKYRADLPLPERSQHVRTCVYESFDATIDVKKSTPAPNSGVVTQAPPAPVGVEHRISRAGGAMACTAKGGR